MYCAITLSCGCPCGGAPAPSGAAIASMRHDVSSHRCSGLRRRVANIAITGEQGSARRRDVSRSSPLAMWRRSGNSGSGTRRHCSGSRSTTPSARAARPAAQAPRSDPAAAAPGAAKGPAASVINPGISSRIPAIRMRLPVPSACKRGEAAFAQRDAHARDMAAAGMTQDKDTGEGGRSDQYQSRQHADLGGHCDEGRQFHHRQRQQGEQQLFCHIHRRFSSASEVGGRVTIV